MLTFFTICVKFQTCACRLHSPAAWKHLYCLGTGTRNILYYLDQKLTINSKYYKLSKIHKCWNKDHTSYLNYVFIINNDKAVSTYIFLSFFFSSFIIPIFFFYKYSLTFHLSYTVFKHQRFYINKISINLHWQSASSLLSPQSSK